MLSNRVKMGQIWKAMHDFKVTFTGFEGCIIPKDTRVVVISIPFPIIQSFYHVMPLTTYGLDERLLPNIDKMKREKEGYGVPVDKHCFKRSFTIDENQKIVFDNPDVEKFWNFVNGNPLF